MIRSKFRGNYKVEKKSLHHHPYEEKNDPSPKLFVKELDSNQKCPKTLLLIKGNIRRRSETQE